MSDTVFLSKQKLDLDEAARAIQGQIQELQHKYKVLIRGMEQIDKGDDMLNGRGILEDAVREVMRNL
jgi:hypothetical protein